MRARGNSTRYAPRVAAMAPDAPIIGMVEVGSVPDLGERGDDATGQVEEQEPEPPEAVLDVVAEDPQEQQVAQEVQPAAVQELAGQEGQGRGVEPRPAGRTSAVRSAGHDAPRGHERVERVHPAAGQQPELPGEHDEAGDDQADVTTGVRRVGLASRRGITGARGSGLRGRLGRRVASRRRTAPPRRPPDGRGGRPRAAVRDLDERRLVDRVRAQPDQRVRRVLDAGHDVHAAQVGPVGAARRPGGTGR